MEREGRGSRSRRGVFLLSGFASEGMSFLESSQIGKFWSSSGFRRG